VQPSSKYWHRWANFTTRYPRIIVLSVLAVTCFFTYALTYIKVRTNLKEFLSAESIEFFHSVEEKFDLGRFHTIIFETQTNKSLLEPELMHLQLRTLQEIKKRFNVKTYSIIEGIDEGFKRVRKKSLLDYDEYTPFAEALLALSGPRTVRDLEKVSRHFTSHPEAIHFYAKLRAAGALLPGVMGGGASDWKFSVPYIKAIKVLVEIEPALSIAQYTDLLVAMREFTDSAAVPGLNIYHSSVEIETHDIDVHARKNVFLMGLLLLIADFLLLWTIFKSQREVWVSLIIMITSCLWTFGAAALLGIQLSFLQLLVLPILLGTGIDDSVVFGRRLIEELDQQKPLTETIASVYAATGNGIFLTTFTTFLAFLCGALLARSYAISSFNILVSLSMVVVFFLTILLQGSIRSLPIRTAVKKKAPRVEKNQASPPFLLGGPTRLALKGLINRPRIILLCTGMLWLLACLSMMNLESRHQQTDFLRRGMPSYVAHELREKYFGRSASSYVMIEGNVEDPQVLMKTRLFIERMKQHPLIEKVLGRPSTDSIFDLIDKKMMRIRPTTDIVAILDQITQDDSTANYVLDKSYKEQARHRVHKSGAHYDGLLIHSFVELEPAEVLRNEMKMLQRDFEDVGLGEISGITMQMGGAAFTFARESGFYIRDFTRSFLLSLLVNALVLLILWRKFWHAALAVLPILISVSLTLGGMAAVGIPLNPLNLIIGAIVVGLGIDYPIHIIERFEEERKRNPQLTSLATAQTVLKQMGPYLWGACLTSIIGFCASVVLAMPIAESFGLLTGLALFLAYAATIFIVPILLIKLPLERN